MTIGMLGYYVDLVMSEELISPNYLPVDASNRSNGVFASRTVLFNYGTTYKFIRIELLARKRKSIVL